MNKGSWNSKGLRHKTLTLLGSDYHITLVQKKFESELEPQSSWVTSQGQNENLHRRREPRLFKNKQTHQTNQPKPNNNKKHMQIKQYPPPGNSVRALGWVQITRKKLTAARWRPCLTRTAQGHSGAVSCRTSTFFSIHMWRSYTTALTTLLSSPCPRKSQGSSTLWGGK